MTELSDCLKALLPGFNQDFGEYLFCECVLSKPYWQQQRPGNFLGVVLLVFSMGDSVKDQTSGATQGARMENQYCRGTLHMYKLIHISHIHMIIFAYVTVTVTSVVINVRQVESCPFVLRHVPVVLLRMKV